MNMKNIVCKDKNKEDSRHPIALKRNFTQVPNEVLENCDVSISARYLLIVLLRYMMQKDFCFPSQKTLSKDLGFTSRYIRTLLKELECKKYLRKNRFGFNTSNTYIIGPALNWKYSSYHIGTTVPEYKGTTVPTKNMNGRIINKNNLIKINKIRKECSDKIGGFDNL